MRKIPWRKLLEERKQKVFVSEDLMAMFYDLCSLWFANWGGACNVKGSIIGGNPLPFALYQVGSSKTWSGNRQTDRESPYTIYHNEMSMIWHDNFLYFWHHGLLFSWWLLLTSMKKRKQDRRFAWWWWQEEYVTWIFDQTGGPQSLKE